MFFDDYKNFPNARINPALLWEYDQLHVNYTQLRHVIVQRVIERGWPNDWRAMLNLYGIAGVKAAIQNLPYLNAKDLNFVCHQFDIPLSTMKCYKKKQLVNSHWNV